MPQPAKARTILIVDDNVTNLKVAVEHLRAYSYTILTASSGETGLERARLAQPDVILLDLRMPGIDGIETCRRLKANPATSPIPVIFMSALGETEDKVRGLEAGAVDYITKPIEAAELLARVQTHLTLSDLQQRLEARVQERTAALEEEAARRRRANEEKDLLLNLVRQQSEQLRQLTQQSLAGQARRDQGLARALQNQVAAKMDALASTLRQAQQWLASPEARDPAHGQAQEQLAQAQSALGEVREHIRRVTDNLAAEPLTYQEVRDSPLFRLTTREFEVLQLIVQGKSHAEIASLLAVAKPTVSTYRARIMKKLGLRDLPALMRFALEHRLLT